MDFFDSLIDNVLTFISDYAQNTYEYENDSAWNDVGYNQVILQRDSAYELNGMGFNLITSSSVKDGIVLIGEDLNQIKNDSKFARISLVQIENVEDEQRTHDLIRKIEYVKYHSFPDGYMMRTSSSAHKEAVRVAKAAVKNNIDFKAIGNLFINKYKENPAVSGVKIIFITNPDVDYSFLAQIADKSNSITKALNHVMNSVNFDCDTCNLKPVCDEVEGMKELHFKNVSQEK